MMLLVPILGAGIAAQSIKGAARLLRRRGRSLSHMTDSESFPNLHAVLTGALAYQVGQRSGFGSLEFTVAAVLGLVLLYDTSGVKRAAGRQAWLLNRLSEVRAGKRPLLELPGQSPIRTWAAALFGVVAGWAVERVLLAMGGSAW